MIAPFILFPIVLIALGIWGTVREFSRPPITNVDDSYYEGYNDVYDEGYNDGIELGYNEGHHDGIYYDWEENIDEIGSYFEQEAVYYDKDNGGWHPEEAWEIIEAYQNNEPFYSDGSQPSKQDYMDAINSLIYFYDYFYSERYE